MSIGKTSEKSQKERPGSSGAQPQQYETSHLTDVCGLQAAMPARPEIFGENVGARCDRVRRALHIDKRKRITSAPFIRSITMDGVCLCTPALEKQAVFPYYGDSCIHIHTSLQGGIHLRPLQISAETALKLAKKLNVPLEQLMHMPQHILMKKMMELAQQEQTDLEDTKGGENHE